MKTPYNNWLFETATNIAGAIAICTVEVGVFFGIGELLLRKKELHDKLSKEKDAGMKRD